MKTVGIIGGLSPESTVKYYEWLNEGVRKKLGGHHSAKLLLSSVDFGQFIALKELGDWDTQGRLLAQEAVALERAGANFIVLATNTMHMVAPQIEAAIKIPFLHLADATSNRILESSTRNVGLLGTRYTMEMDFYKARLTAKGLTPIIPDEAQRKRVNDIIYDELCHGRILPESRKIYRDVIASLVSRGAQGVIMGCTEITMLIDQSDSPVPLFDTTKIHVEEALKAMFAEP
ncbi:MAG: aspartate/glutamate racemase family protein [Alphaproteobacteria bacterium]|nr:aspartate/glutamate racemase family protein [Alphaproteobacteria bacterium]